MKVSLYVHAWQALLMFLGGLVAVLCSFVGFLRTGGGEQLLQQALVSFPFIKGGKSKFRSLTMDLSGSKLVVHALEHTDLTDGENRASGLRADRCEVHLDFWPRLEVLSVDFIGMRDLRFQVRKDYLQQQRETSGPRFPVRFKDVDCEVRIGQGPPLKLAGCSGVLEPRGQNPAALAGEFRLTALNGRPFNLEVASLKDGRWEVRGTQLAIDTRLAPQPAVPADAAPGVFDPMDFLIGVLLTGERGAAKGTVSLSLVVQPALPGQPFVCEGQLAYRNLVLSPRAQDVQGGVLPVFLRWLTWGRETPLPGLLTADGVKTGPEGRLAFHMEGNRLDFACDEGPGNALIPQRGGADLTPIESLKGSVWTDAEKRPELVVLRAVVDRTINAELRMRRGAADRGEYELVLEPRVAGLGAPDSRVPLWRIHVQLEDGGGRPGDGAERPLLKFRSVVTSMHFQDNSPLPPGVRDFSGTLRFAGELRADRRILLDVIQWEDGGLAFGGPDPAPSGTAAGKYYGTAFECLKNLWGGGPVWRLQGVRLRGKGEVTFGMDGRWASTRLTGWRLEQGTVLYESVATDLGAVGIEVEGEYRRDREDSSLSNLLFKAFSREPDGAESDWRMSLLGVVKDDGTGVVRFEERRVPLKWHPERARMDGRWVDGPFDRRVKRKRELQIEQGGRPVLRFLPLE